MDSKEILNVVLSHLKNTVKPVVAELNGNYFSGADIAVKDDEGNTKVFCLMITEHGNHKSFT